MKRTIPTLWMDVNRRGRYERLRAYVNRRRDGDRQSRRWRCYGCLCAILLRGLAAPLYTLPRVIELSAKGHRLPALAM